MHGHTDIKLTTVVHRKCWYKRAMFLVFLIYKAFHMTQQPDDAITLISPYNITRCWWSFTFLLFTWMITTSGYAISTETVAGRTTCYCSYFAPRGNVAINRLWHTGGWSTDCGTQVADQPTDYKSACGFVWKEAQEGKGRPPRKLQQTAVENTREGVKGN